MDSRHPLLAAMSSALSMQFKATRTRERNPYLDLVNFCASETTYCKESEASDPSGSTMEPDKAMQKCSNFGV